MHRQFKYLKPYMLFVVLSPLFMILEVSTELFIPKIMSSIIDVGVANHDTSYIFSRGLFMVFLAFLGVVGGVGCTFFSTKAAQGYGTDIRSDLFRKIQNFSFVNLDKFHASTLITRLTNDVTQAQLVIMMSLRMLVRSPATFIGGIIMALSLNAELTKILLVAIFIIIASISLIIKYAFPLFTTVQKKVDKINSTLRENLAGVRVIKAFVCEEKETEKFAASNTDLRDSFIRAFRVLTLMMPVMHLVLHLTTVFIVWNGGKLVNSGIMESGELMAFITYLTQILMSLMMVSMALMQFSRAKVSIDRIYEVLDTKIDIIDPKKPADCPIKEGNIEFDKVAFRYPQSTGSPVLSDINLKLSAGETIGIIGETGSGKSTLVNLIPRLYDVTEGSVKIDGVDVRDISLEHLRNNIGIVLQKSILFSGTIKENLLWGKADATAEELIECTKAAQAYDFISGFSDGFDTVLGQMGVNLSGGQKQRISIARTLLKSPKILIFDDSTSALDMATEAKIQSALKTYCNNSTKIIIAQKISSVINADKIIVLSDGKISGLGTHSELIKSNDIYREICISQMGEEAVENV